MSWGYEPDERRNVYLKLLSNTEAVLYMEENREAERMSIEGARSAEQAHLLALAKAAERCFDACPMKYYQVRGVPNPYLLGERKPTTPKLSALLEQVKRSIRGTESSTIVFRPATEDELEKILANRKVVGWDQATY